MRVLIPTLILLMLASCGARQTVSAPAAPIRTDLKITDVKVSFSQTPKIWWTAAEGTYAAQNGCRSEGSDCDYWAFIKKPETKAYVRDRIAKSVTPVIAPALRSAWNGGRAVTAEVTIGRFIIISEGRTALFGGRHEFVADLAIVDPDTRKVLAFYPSVYALAGTGQGGVLGLVTEAALSTSGAAPRRLAEEFSRLATNWMTGAR